MAYPRSENVLSLDRLKEVLIYAPETGEFKWRVKPRQRACSEIAGSRNPSGYIQICVDQQVYKAHRLAWFYVYGVWPTTPHLDHINGDRSDNRISNLREADFSQNQANSKVRATNKIGLKGVSFHPLSGLWTARVVKGGKSAYCAYFKTPEEAHAAYKAAATRIFGEFARAD
jgi:hypothetical protein